MAGRRYGVKILLVEDDEDKLDQIREFLVAVEADWQIEQTRSLNSGLRAVQSGEYDIIILDMTMPAFDITLRDDGGRPQAFAGRELLRHMHRRKNLTPVVVL